MNRRQFVKGAAAAGVTVSPLASALTATAAEEHRMNGGGMDWPVYRHDAALSAISPLKGGLGQAPRVVWSLDLGGRRVPAERIVIADVTGDGRDDFLAMDAETVTARDARGRQRWRLEGYPNARVEDVSDYAGDGSRGILLTTSLAGRVETFMVAGRTGKAVPLWQDENNFGGHTRFGKLLPHVRGTQIASTASGTAPPAPWGGNVRLVSFAEGLERPRFHIQQFVEGTLYSPLMLFADMDADGRDEMVVISHEEMWTFDPATGQQKSHAQYAPTIRTYSASIAAVRLAPEDRFPSLVMINPHIPGVKAVRQDGRTASTLWKVVVGAKEDQYQGEVRIVPAGPDPVYDLSGDGHYRVLAAITNERGDGAPRLAVFDARDGKRLAETEDARVLAVEDLDGDGKPEIMLQRGDRLHIARWTGDGFRDLWEGEHVAPLLQPLPPEGALTRTASGNARVWREAPGASRFLLRFPDGVRSCRLAADRLETGELVTRHAALGNAGEPPAERVIWDRQAVVTRTGEQEVYRYEPPAPQTYLAPPPLVADLGGRRRVLVRDAEGRLVTCTPRGERGTVLSERLFEKFQNHVDAAGAGPTVCDIDGDGENEVVATVTDAEGTPYLAILDAAGQLKRRIDLLPGTRVVNRGPTGSLGPGRGRWIVLRMFYGEGAYQGRYPVVAAFDGRTGERLWMREDYSSGAGYKNAAIFAAHLPTAVFDYDGDGADDWVVCSENFYGIISVKDNRDLVGPVILSDAIPGHWTAYSYPSLGNLTGNGKRVLFHHSAYSLVLVTDLEGRPLCHHGLTRDTGGAWGVLADVDGDGRQEVVHAQPDGTLRCFASAATEAKCPSCPPDAALSAVNHGVRQRWQHAVKRPISRVIAADVDADGRHELLFGGSDGHLYALGEREGKPQLLWSVSLGRRVGEPILADVDQDGRAEILVPVEDGRLYCLRSA